MKKQGKKILLVGSNAETEDIFRSVLNETELDFEHIDQLNLSRPQTGEFRAVFLNFSRSDGEEVKFLAEIFRKDPTIILIGLDSNRDMLKTKPEVFIYLDFLLSYPLKEDILRNILVLITADSHERRLSIRKLTHPSAWVAKYNEKLGKPEIFESPFIYNISKNGLSFQSCLPYKEGDRITIWIFEPISSKILELEAKLMWRKKSDKIQGELQYFRHGLEFTEHLPQMNDYRKLVAGIIL